MSHINPGPVCPVDVGSGSAGGGNSVEAEDKNAGADAVMYGAARAVVLPVRNSWLTMLRLSFGDRILHRCPPCA